MKVFRTKAHKVDKPQVTPVDLDKYPQQDIARPIVLRYLTVDEVKALNPDPENPRRHPPEQAKGLIAAAKEIESLADEGTLPGTGMLVPLQYNILEDKFLDGHLRQEVIDELPTTIDGRIPVEFGQWNSEQHRLAILTRDPLVGLAEVDTDVMKRLRAQVDSIDDEVNKLLQQITDEAGIPRDEGWGGKDQIDLDDIDDYDPDKEVCSIRLNGVLVLDKELIVGIVEEAIDGLLDYKVVVEVF